VPPGDDPADNNKVRVVVIDPGHGGKDPGALGKHVKEKDIVLAVGLKLGEYISKNMPDVKVVYTRNTDVFVPLPERAEIANKNKADLFISIHANSLPGSPAFGTETFVMGEHKNESNFEVAKLENSVIAFEEDYSTTYEGFDPNSPESYIIFSLMQSIHKDQSLKFASLVQDEFREKARRVDRGVKQAGFLVLWKTSMPSVLVETGFLTHEAEEKYLGSEMGQEHLASAIYRAFRSYKEYVERNSKIESRPPDSTLRNNGNGIMSTAVNGKPPSHPYFKVQIFASRNQVSFTDDRLKKYPLLEEFRAGKWYKYAAGKSYSYQEILALCNSIRKDYPDAFVIAVKNGEIVPLKEAVDLNKD
jgi:N-acetylmuramoyl-L-alanine amidase